MTSKLTMTNNQLTAGSTLLSSFYIAYHSWIRNGAKSGDIFSRNTGLCVGAYDFFKSIGVDPTEPLEEMHKQFVASGLNEKLPFNDDPNQYTEESAQAECHCNSRRVTWVESRCAEIQERRKAAMDSDPVGEFYEDGPKNWYQISDGDRVPDSRRIPLYRHAQPPSVPDRSIFEKWWESQNGAPLDGWDSLRTVDGYCDEGIDGQFEAWNAGCNNFIRK